MKKLSYILIIILSLPLFTGCTLDKRNINTKDISSNTDSMSNAQISNKQNTSSQKNDARIDDNTTTISKEINDSLDNMDKTLNQLDDEKELNESDNLINNLK